MSAQRISSANFDSCRQLVAEANQLGKRFSDLIEKTNKEHPHQSDIHALRSLLSENRGLQLWRDTTGIAQKAETVTLEKASLSAALKELLKHRLEALRIEHGYTDAPVMLRRARFGYGRARYEIRSKIGEGGMGEVYLAEDTGLHRKVALKILSADVASNQDRMRRFNQEATAAAALSHPNIAHIYETRVYRRARRRL